MDIINLVGKLPRNPKRKFATRERKDIGWVAVHHLGTGVKNNKGATPLSVARYHVGPNHISKQGCPTVCYHIMVSQDGTVYKTENYSTVTWNVNWMYNKSAIGILLLDDLDMNEPSPEMVESLIRVIGEELFPIYTQLSYVKVRGHREFKLVHKSCPGKNVDMKAIRVAIRDRYR